MFDGLAESWLAHRISESQVLTAGLSAVHLLGYALVMAAGLVSNLRLMGAVLGDRPLVDIVRPASKMLTTGLGVSAVTGLLMFVPRAPGAAANEFFRAKMLLLVAVIAFSAVLQRRLVARGPAVQAVPLLGLLGLVLWVALAVAAAAFILIE